MHPEASPGDKPTIKSTTCSHTQLQQVPRSQPTRQIDRQYATSTPCAPWPNEAFLGSISATHRGHILNFHHQSQAPLCLASIDTFCTFKICRKRGNMRFKRLLLVATSLGTTVFAAPLPLHDTNTQRLPDHPAIIEHSDMPATVMVQKHKYVPEIVEPILRLCERSLGQ